MEGIGIGCRLEQARDLRFIPMKSAAVLFLLVFAVPSCSQSDDVTGSTDGCATAIFPAYNPKAMDQCVEACKKCQHGVTVTCTTSCTLKGAK